jgi:Asp-tRNA(Asn)/Glu-tRNA(Gln) amidotransferase A subunit family amidase
VYEASIQDLQNAMAQGRTTSVALVNAYLARIAAYDHSGPSLNAILRINPNARATAAALDAERRAGKVRGPLHGIPIILKDNYATTDMPTSAGSIALAGMQTPFDAFQVKKLRDAGAVIIAKSTMHEMASGITTISSITGQTCNPYDPDRNPGGSSGGSGAAVAASFAAIAWGSDTCGSIRIPSAVHNLVGLRPTKGLSSIAGIVPLSHTQDVGGPLARSVRDLAIGLDATIGADPADSATRILDGATLPRFVESLDSTALRGKRLGVLTAHLGNEADDAEGTRVVRAALDKMKARGAEIVDITIPTLDSIIGGAGVIDFELKPDLLGYLAAVPNAPVKSLGEIIDRGLLHTQLDVALRRREANGNITGDPYRLALARRVTARDLVVAFMDENRLDAIVYPTMRRKAALINEPQRGANCQLSAVTGLPALSVPAGFTPDGLPIGVELLGRALSDAKLLAMAYDYEQSVKPRRAPSTTPALVDGRAPLPKTIRATAKSGATSALGQFTFDPTRRTLDYSVAVTGAAPSRIFAMTIDHDSAGKKGAVIRHLSGPGIGSTKGRLTLGDVERRELLAGNLSLVVYTADQPMGTIRAPLTLPR